MTDDEIDAIVEELLDEATQQAWGPEAGFILAIQLGLIDGDVVELDDQGQGVVTASNEAIQSAIADAREARAKGMTMADFFG